MVIEVDGDVHLDKTVQIEDDTKLESLLAMNLKVIRCTNHMVINHLDKVIDDIKKELFQLNPNPMG